MVTSINTRTSRTFSLLVVICLFSFPVYAQYSGGTGEPNDPYKIATTEQLISIGSDPNLLYKHFELVEDIYLDPNLPLGGPIMYHFSGVFDGNDHIISNLTIESQWRWPRAGFFGELHVGAVVKDLGIVDANITMLYNGGGYVGGIAGQNDGNINSCYVTGLINGDSAGSLAGSNSGNIFECWSAGKVHGLAQVGGLVGINDANVINCTSSCDVIGIKNVGGLMGVNSGTIENSQASGSVDGFENIGGLVGSNGTSHYVQGKSLSDSGYIYSGGSILNCYATGKVTGKKNDYFECKNIGGLVGYSQGDMIYMSYALGDVTGADDSTCIGGLVGKHEREKIICCYAEGDVEGTINVGGLTGENLGDIDCCYAIGKVKGKKGYGFGAGIPSGAGGLVGWNGGDVVNSYTRGAVSSDLEVGGLIGYNNGQVNNCYATGKVFSWVREAGGGLVGLTREPSWPSPQYTAGGGLTEQCYYLDPNSHDYGPPPPPPWPDRREILNNGFGEPLTDIQMKREDSFELWDFVDEIENGTEEIWWILEGQDYPRLWWEPGPNDSNEPVIPDDAFVDINDPGIPGHEGFNGEMCKYEITNAQYCQYLNAALSDGLIVDYNDLVFDANDTEHARPYFVICNDPNEKYSSQIAYNQGLFTVRNRIRYNTAEHPVVEVSWYGATAFCDYYGYRLPTEWEWQAVADYDGSYIYGCGTGIVDVIANYGFFPGPGPSGRWYDTHTAPVGFYSPFGYGMCDMAGNVWEWTSSISGNSGVIRGGSWGSYRLDCRVWSSYHPNLDTTGNEVGFRVCR